MVSWQGATAAEYALVKGKTYTFSLSWVATDPEYDDTPKPDYDWCCLINGSTDVGVCAGLYSTGAFIVEDPGRLLTELTSGNESNITLGREGKIIVPKIVTETVATSPSDRTRKTVGVGEVVNLTLVPDLPSTVTPTWAKNGDGVFDDEEMSFTAPDRTAVTTISVNFGSGASCSTEFQTVEPSDILFENFYINEVVSFAPPAQRYFCVGYGAKVYFRPDTVNFGKITLLESSAITQTEPGYFRDYPPPSHDEWSTPRSLVSDGSTWVEGKGTMGNWAEGDNITGITPDVDQYPLRNGYAWWNIQWRFSVGNGAFKTFRVACQDFKVTGSGTNGTFRITKGASGAKGTSGAEIATGDTTAHFIAP